MWEVKEKEGHLVHLAIWGLPDLRGSLEILEVLAIQVSSVFYNSESWKHGYLAWPSPAGITSVKMESYVGFCTPVGLYFDLQILRH